MRIQNNNNYNYPTFKSKESLKKICLETLDEFNQEFKGVKSPTKFFQESENAKCATKENLFYKLGWIWNSKFKQMKTEYKTFLGTDPSNYEKNMQKLGELMKKHKVANCGYMNEYFQYMLAKKGIYSEAEGLLIYNHKPLSEYDSPEKNHLYLKIKDSENNSFAADSWMGTIGNSKSFLQKAFKYLKLDKSRQYIYTKGPLMLKGYKEFISKLNPINPPKQL